MQGTNMDPEEDLLQMHLLHDYDLVSVRSQHLYKNLLESLDSKDFRSFKSIIDQSLRKYPPIININYRYPNHSDETLLDIACQKGLTDFVQYLLEKEASVNRVNEAHNRGPIHFATEKGYRDVLRVLLEEPTINPNLEASQQTALHMAVKKNDLNCAALLLEKGASPNIPNNKGLTALHLAAMKSQLDMVNLILQKSTHSLDLDSYKDYNNKTARDVLQKKLPNVPLPPIQERGVNVHDLKYYLNANDQTNFLKCLEVVQDDVVNNVAEDLIEMAVQKNFETTVAKLLERTKESGCNLDKAANVAVQKGLPDILRRILNTDCRIGNELLLNACLELGILGKEENVSNRVECLKMILDRDEVNVRCTDSKGNTPLHYAARADCREAVTLLLEKGSYIGHMNKFGVPPVADISISTLSQHFDDCIQTRKERTNEYTIEFDYKCLIPHDVPHTSDNKLLINEAKREMDTFQFIANNGNLKHLLKHPLLTSFLYLKWHRIRHIFWLNLSFYILLYLLLNSYILYDTYQNTTPTNSSNQFNQESLMQSTSMQGSVWQMFTGIVLALLVVREILQFVSSPCHYISTLENWLEIALIVLGFTVLYGAGRQVAAVVILLSAWELVILIGQHPRMSTGIEMFKTVSLNFMRFLFLYAFLILAFALAFFTLFKDSDSENFPDPGHSLFKTIIMLTGEFDANDIPFISRPILSHLVFLLFVFLIVIVLFNLLNGLAVSDTVDILGKAELVGLISRIRLVAYIENVAVKAPLVHGPHCLMCQGFTHSWNCNPLAFLVKKILLFPEYLKNGKLSVQPYESLEAYTDRKYYRKGQNKDSDSMSKVFPTFKMDPHVIKQTKEVLSRKGRESDTERVICKLDRIKERLSSIENALNAMKQGLNNNNIDIERDSEN